MVDEQDQYPTSSRSSPTRPDSIEFDPNPERIIRLIQLIIGLLHLRTVFGFASRKNPLLPLVIENSTANHHVVGHPLLL